VAVFEEVTLTWDGQDYKIPPERVLKCIASVEEVLPLWRVSQATVGDLRLADLAEAYSAVLRFAGANVSADEFYSRLFDGDGPELAKKARAYCYALQALMIPPKHLRGNQAEGAKKDEATRAAGSSPSATSSS